jgi:hypothetical protein
MKVKDLIANLKHYKEDQELLVVYWDKEYAEESLNEGVILTDTAWAAAIQRTEDMDFWQECASNELTDQVLLAIEAEGEGEDRD